MNDQEWKDAQARLESGVEHRQRVATDERAATPRTDALAETFWQLPNWHAIVDAAVEHARQLERELDAVKGFYRIEVAAHRETVRLTNAEQDRLERELAEAKRDAELRAADALRWRERFEALEGASKAPRSGCKVCGGTSASQCALRAGWQCEHAPSATAQRDDDTLPDAQPYPAHFGEGIDSPHNACMFREACQVMKRTLARSEITRAPDPRVVPEACPKAAWKSGTNGRWSCDYPDCTCDVPHRAACSATPRASQHFPLDEIAVKNLADWMNDGDGGLQEVTLHVDFDGQLSVSITEYPEEGAMPLFTPSVPDRTSS